MTKEEGDWLRYCLRVIGKKHKDIYEELGISKSYFSMIINGERQAPQIEAKLTRFRLEAEKKIRERPAQYMDIPPQVINLLNLLTKKD